MDTMKIVFKSKTFNLMYLVYLVFMLLGSIKGRLALL